LSVVVEVVDRTGSGQAQGPVIELVEAILDAEGVAGTVTVAFVDEKTIAELNGRYRGLSEPTDVLSFSYAEDDARWPDLQDSDAAADGIYRDGIRAEGILRGGTSLPDLGEVVVCPAVVRRYSDEDDGDPDRQLGWTIMHGVLHLVGYDHERDSGEMRERERVLLGDLDREVRAASLGADN
jgi:probable rRNA maturation factor